MKKVSRRAVCALLLALALTVGSVAFAVRYIAKADEWVTFPGSPHVYSGANVACGCVTDRAGQILLETISGRVYSQDPQVRAATMHLLGDRYGYISAPLLGAYADEMIGYDKILGLHGTGVGNSAAKLTISADVQKTALAALSGYCGTIGVYNYKTGEILCAATSPSYDPDNMPDVENDTTGAYYGVYVNRFFRSTYTPGSIFKLVTAAAALEEIEDIESRTFNCSGETIIGGQRIICMGHHGNLTLQQALAHSCNVAFGELAAELGAKKLQKYADRLGVAARYAVDGFKTAEGCFNLSGAESGDTAWAGIGQYSDQVNAYAFMRYMGMLGGGEAAAEPYLMAEVRCADEVSYEAKTAPIGKVLKEETRQSLAQMMRRNVTDMYGDWQFPGLSVCAKSGTAEVEGQKPHAMFAGFVQDEAYPLAFVVFVEHAGAGSSVAAPMAAKVLAACVQCMNAEQ